MQSLLLKLRRLFRYAYVKTYRRLWPIAAEATISYHQLGLYYENHKRLRRTTVFIGPALLFLLTLLLVIFIETPSRSELSIIKNAVASEVYSADSVLLGRYYIQDRTEIKYKDIAPVAVDALIATEDVRFYDHEGVDYLSLGRVLVKSILQQDESAGGGSTLTQQLAKNLYPRKHYWMLSMLINKLRELITAQRLENVYSKEDLITLYLNTVPFADNVYGIQAASQRFFSTQAKNLTVNQAAVLIGMLKATHYYNPRLFPDRARERRNVVLTQMVKYNKLEKEKAAKLKTAPLKLKYSRTSYHEGLAPYFREYLKTELIAWCKNNTKEDGTPYNLYTDGLKIYTTLDSRLQKYAERAMEQQMVEIQKQFFDHWGKEKPWKGKDWVLQEAIQRSSRYRQLKQRGLSEKQIMKEMQRPETLRVFTWKGEQEKKISPIDSIIHHLQYLNAGFMAMDPETGHVKAWVGGIDHDFYQYDHVKVTTKRQVGSIFKPLVYAMAIENGVSPCELTTAERQTYIDEEGEKWTPRNMQNDYGVKYTMRGALAYSVNTIAVKLIQRAGVDNTIELAHHMGISSEMPDVPSIALGSSSISLMEMTAAYACFASNGIVSYPYCVQSIRDLDGKEYNGFKPEMSGKRAMSQETAQIMQHLLRTVVHEGTASRLRWKYGVYNDVAGKTGTTQQNADGWFMALTPKLVMGSWVGADDPRIRFRYTNLGQGSNTALPIVAYFLKQVNQDRSYKTISDAQFAPLPRALQHRLDCDLYELNDELLTQVQALIHQRDSIMHADSLAVIPEETFLEMLYKRKLRIMEAIQLRDSVKREIQALEGAETTTTTQ